MLVRLAWTGSPAPACKLALAGTPAKPCQPHRFSPLQEKKNIRHGYQEDTGHKVKVQQFQQVCRFHFGLIQLIRFIIVMVWSNTFCHLDLVQFITLSLNYNKPGSYLNMCCYSGQRPAILSFKLESSKLFEKVW